MKKLGRFTIIDIAIVLLLISGLLYGFLKTSDFESNIQKFTFDASEMSKVYQKYNELYGQGKIINSKITGYNSLTRKREEIYGRVLWLGNTDVLLNSDGKKILVSGYQNKYADYYMESITLEVTGTEKNAVDVVFEPLNIRKMSDLLIDIPEIKDYKITTKITIKNKDVVAFQQLSNELYNKEKHVSIIINVPYDRIEISQATDKEIKIADRILGEIDGQTEFITIRIYNADDEIIEKIKNKYRVNKVIDFALL